jgi:tetratricopeptide (TPR) repeat protein
LQRYREAIACYDQAIKLHPDIADIWYNKGATLCKIKRYPDALKCFERVLELEPDHALARTAQTLVIAIPPVFDPMRKLTELDKDKEDEMSEEVKLYLKREREASKERYGEMEMG